MIFQLAVLFTAVVCIACAGSPKRGIEANLISEMGRDCKQVEIKRDYDQAVYVITYTGKVSGNRCPIALIQGWKDGRAIIKKEVEICACRDR